MMPCSEYLSLFQVWCVLPCSACVSYGTWLTLPSLLPADHHPASPTGHGGPTLTAEADLALFLIYVNKTLLQPVPMWLLFFLVTPASANQAVGWHPRTAALCVGQQVSYAWHLVSPDSDFCSSIPAKLLKVFFTSHLPFLESSVPPRHNSPT